MHQVGEATQVEAEVDAAFDAAASVVERAGSLALACHGHPDGDALGSALAMHLLCRSHGRASTVSWPAPFTVAPHYRFLPGLELATDPAMFPSEPEVMLTFDLGSFDRLGELASAARATHRRGHLVVLDHHHDNQRFGTVNLVWTDAAATAVVVHELARRLGWSLDRDVALALYVGLVTDTGRFRHPNTTPSVLALADELRAYDIPAATVEAQLFDEHRPGYHALATTVVDRALIDPERHLVASWTTLGDLRDHDLAFDETEGLIDHLGREVGEVVVCLVKEAPGEGRRVSLRSDGTVDVAAIAAALGGGGHAFMAGFTSDDPPDVVIDCVRRALRP
jgi:phosphoesterase RecJ-like protein